MSDILPAALSAFCVILLLLLIRERDRHRREFARLERAISEQDRRLLGSEEYARAPDHIRSLERAIFDQLFTTANLEESVTRREKLLASLVDGLSDAVLVTVVVETSGLDHSLDGSGFLVPRSEGLLMTACSWASSKWAHYDDGRHAILRVSAGRTDDPRWLDLDPAQLLDQLRAELAETIGLHAEPVARITPWRQSLPQYRPGHFARCDEIDAELALAAEGLVVTGAQMRGLGLPACVRQGRAAIA